MTAREDREQLAMSEFNAAFAGLSKQMPGKAGFGAEAKYGQAYQQLVLLGMRPQIRLKYRGV